MSKIDIGEIEVHAFHQHVACDEHLLVGIVEHGTVVTYTVSGCRVSGFDIVGEMMDQAELTELGYVCHRFTFKGMCLNSAGSSLA